MLLMRSLLLTVLVCAGGAASGQTQALKFQSSDKQTALLELYTSEGCSSCRPAEAWLSRLKNASELWRDFVPVAFHVDYWDYLGWRDQWATKDFSERQRAYAASWRSDSVYTPGFVLNGREWRGWSGFGRFRPARCTIVGFLTVSSTDTNRWQVSFIPTAPRKQQYDAQAVLLACGLKSNVKAGENRGRQLEHDFVALALVRRPLKPRDVQDAAVQVEFVLGAKLKNEQGRLALAVWVTRANESAPLQATGGWLR